MANSRTPLDESGKMVWRCSNHEDMVKAMASLEQTIKSLAEQVRDLKRADDKTFDSLQTSRATIEAYVDARVDRQAGELKTCINETESRLNARIDDLPGRIAALEQTQNQQLGAQTMANQTHDRMPKWASVAVAVIAVGMSAAISLFIAYITYANR